ncbi:MAG: hypothetical protein GC199_06725 [Alphaproteobacteria bacterium]|nr:hypothetical protein [Alphaproteobacteria bacterium]
MFRGLIGSTIFVIGGAAVASYAIYGAVEPCEVLAREYAMRAEKDAGVVGDIVNFEGIYRLQTDNYETGECVGKLFDSWVERITG